MKQTGRDGPRLCIVNLHLPPAYGGAEIAAYRYAERYCEAGGQVVLIGPENEVAGPIETPSWVVPVPRLGRRDLERAARFPGVSTLRKATRAWSTFRRMRDEFDVVHIFNAAPLFNLGTIPLAKFLRKPVVLEMSLRGSDDPVSLKQSRKRRVPTLGLPPVRYQLFRLADRFVAKSKALSDAFLESGLDEQRLIRIPYGVDVDRYQPVSDEAKDGLRARLGLERSAVLILFVGSLNPRKGVHWLLEAFSRLPSDSSAELVLVGPDDKFPGYAAELREQASRSGVAGRINFVTTNADNVEEYMQAADVFALTSVREGLPIAVLEAMASGMAIVASDIPEIADSQIRSGSEGLLFPTGDVERLTSALTHLVLDPEERLRLGRRARERAVREFADTLVDSQYRELYEGLLRRA